MSSLRRTAPAALLALTLVALLLANVAAAQGVGVERPDVPPLLQGAGGFVATLVVGAIVLFAAPEYVDRVVGRARDDPVLSFVWGLGLSVAAGVLIFVLFVTVIGIVIAIPLAIALAVVGAVGNVLGYLALLAGVVDDRWVALVVAAAVAGTMAAIPLLGDLVVLVVGSVGFGAMAIDYRD